MMSRPQFIFISILSVMIYTGCRTIQPQSEAFTIRVLETDHGSLNIIPGVSEGNKYNKDTAFTINAVPDPGYVVDSIYATPRDKWWEYFYDIPDSAVTIKISSDTDIGACFLPNEDLRNISVINNVIYAKPGKKELKYDVYKPTGADNLPAIIIIHGGGWAINNEDVMRGMGREIAKTGRYVAVSIDYRWIGTKDGDNTPNSLQDLICDCYGAIAHVMEHAGEYGIDPQRIAVTGDSAGGHLSASVATMIERLGNKELGDSRIIPTYLPKGMTPEYFREMLSHSLKAAAPSYGVFSVTGLNVGPEVKIGYENVSPIDNIPPAIVRKIPHYLVLGTLDTISESTVLAYVNALHDKGQEAVYVPVEGARHAFYDWKPDNYTQEIFYRYGVPNIEKMLTFFDGYLYANK